MASTVLSKDNRGHHTISHTYYHQHFLAIIDLNPGIPPTALNKADQDPTFPYRIRQDEINAIAALNESDQNP